jgi:hypothetical protein
VFRVYAARGVYRFQASGSYASPLARMAQIIRACLLAMATRILIPQSQPRLGHPMLQSRAPLWRLSQGGYERRARPSGKQARTYASPRLVIFPNEVLPPELNCFGASHAAIGRPFLKSRGLVTVAATGLAVIGRTPVIASMRFAASLC